MQYGSTERSFGQVAEQNFYDTVLAHGDGTLVNAPSYNIPVLITSFIGLIICTAISSGIALFVAVTKYQHRQRQERQVGRSQVSSQLQNSNNL